MRNHAYRKRRRFGFAFPGALAMTDSMSETWAPTLSRTCATTVLYDNALGNDVDAAPGGGGGGGCASAKGVLSWGLTDAAVALPDVLSSTARRWGNGAAWGTSGAAWAWTSEDVDWSTN